MLQKKRNFLWVWITLVILIIDRVTKNLIINNLQLEQPVPVLPFFNLLFNYNPGSAFSFLSEAGGWQNWLFGIIAIIISGIIIGKLWKLTIKDRWLEVALALILSGALGNFYDRVVYHRVIDFLDFYVSKYHWPTFNIADTSICIGASLLIWHMLEQDRKHLKK